MLFWVYNGTLGLELKDGEPTMDSRTGGGRFASLSLSLALESRSKGSRELSSSSKACVLKQCDNQSYVLAARLNACIEVNSHVHWFLDDARKSKAFYHAKITSL